MLAWVHDGIIVTGIKHRDQESRMITRENVYNTKAQYRVVLGLELLGNLNLALVVSKSSMISIDVVKM